MKHPYTIVLFLEEISLIFQISDFIGRMSQLETRFWLETDGFFISTGENTEKTRPTAKCISLSYFTTGSNYSKSIETENFQTKNTFCKKPIQMHTTQNPNLLVSYREIFIASTGKKTSLVVDEDSSFSQQPMSSPLVMTL